MSDSFLHRIYPLQCQFYPIFKKNLNCNTFYLVSKLCQSSGPVQCCIVSQSVQPGKFEQSCRESWESGEILPDGVFPPSAVLGSPGPQSSVVAAYVIKLNQYKQFCNKFASPLQPDIEEKRMWSRGNYCYYLSVRR